MVASMHAVGVPIATPDICFQYVSPKANRLFFITDVSAVRRCSVWNGCSLFSGSVCNHFRSSVIAWSGSMFVYIESASDVKRYAALGSGLSFCSRLRRSSESCRRVFTCAFTSLFSWTSSYFER